MSNPSLILPQSPAYGEDYVYAAQVNDGVVPLYNVLPLTFTRASGGTRINKDGLVQNMPYNLVEQSETFSNAVWTTYQSSIAANSTIAPNGTNTADSLFDNTNNDQHLIQQGVATSAGIHTISVYAKSNTLSHAWIKYFNGTSAQESGIYNLSNATVSGSGSIESVGNGWCRLSLQVTTLSNTGYFYIITSDGTNKFYAGTGKSIFIWGYQVNIGSTAQPYLATTDRLNMPRITYPVGGGCGALLLEKQSTNLVFPSEDLTAWSTGGMTNTANQTTSPDGTQNADKSTIGSTTRYYDAVSGVATTVGGTTYTTSFFAKKGTGIEAIYFYQGDGGAKIAKWNLNNGAYIGYAPADGYGAFSAQTSESLGNGWYRFSATYTASGTSGNYVIGVSTNTNDSVTPIAGNGTDFVYIWGLQYEASSYATSYIPTTSTSATRIADACYKTDIGSYFGTNKGTFFWQGVTPYFVSGAAQYLLDISDTINFNLNRFALYMVASNTVQLYTSVTGGNNATLAQNSFAKIAIVWNGTSCSLYINGAVAINQTISNSNPTAFHLNSRYSLNENGNTQVGEVRIYNTNLSNAELIALTTL